MKKIWFEEAWEQDAERGGGIGKPEPLKGNFSRNFLCNSSTI